MSQPPSTIKDPTDRSPTGRRGEGRSTKEKGGRPDSSQHERERYIRIGPSKPAGPAATAAYESLMKVSDGSVISLTDGRHFLMPDLT